MNRRGSRFVLGVAAVLMGGMLAFSMGNGKSHTSYAAADYENTETEKVEADETISMATPGKYKSMDYTFMERLEGGESHQESCVLVFGDVSKMASSKSKKMETGAKVRTRGYEKQGDGGAACYEIVDKDTGECVKLENGKYAKVVPDTYTDSEGCVWALCNVKQFGAKGDGVEEDNYGINAAIRFAGNYVKDTQGVQRGLVYLPDGTYKCTNQLFADTQNLNIVGNGEKTILFTDNDYRKDQGYSEHFFQITNAENLFFGNFRIEAREVDLYHYMRQFTLTYSKNIYVYQVDLIVPQESYNSYYFEDKQYSNFCCYSGNENITVDSCVMKQLSGTYRGANIGVLDIWSTGEKNITIMNCELYGNARDEQIGFFSTEKESASVKNVQFINNTVHSVQLKYPDIIGYRTMCFTIGYADSQNVENIKIAGNHFICETDSKFMTFGSVKNCIVEHNIIEIIASHGMQGAVFDTGNMEAENITVRENQFYITAKTGTEGKSNLVNGALTFEHNQVFLDSGMYLPMFYLKCKAENNQITALKKLGELADNVCSFSNNEITAYEGMGLITNATLVDKDTDLVVSGNVIYNYERAFDDKSKTGPWIALHKIDGLNMRSYTYQNNKYYAPNRELRLNGEQSMASFLYVKPYGAASTIQITGNESQGAKGVIHYGDLSNVTIKEENNTTLDYSVEADAQLVSRIDLKAEGSVVTEQMITEDQVTLQADVFTTSETGIDQMMEGKKLKWYSNVDKIASVSQQGVVTRHMYGDVKIYAVPEDGSQVYGMCILHFVKAKASQLILTKETLSLQPGMRFYAEYQVKPKEACQKLQWTSTNQEVATVSEDGLIEAVAEGTAVIKGRTKDGSNLEKEIVITVSPITVKKITLQESYKVFDASAVGSQYQLEVSSYYPDNAVNKGISKWESNHEEVCRVDETGLVTFVGCGSATIKAYAMDGSCYGSCNLYVTGGTVPGFRAEQVTDTSARLNWDGDGLNGWGFNLYQWDFDKEEWKELAINYKYEDYKVDNLSKNTTYRYCIRYCLKGYDTGREVVYPGEETIVEFTTKSYKAVEKLECETDHITIPYETEGEYKFYYAPKDANYEKLDFDVSIADTDIATIETVRKEENVCYVKMKAQAYGFTKVTVKCNDDQKAEITVPIGVVVKNMVSAQSFKVTAEKGKITAVFDGIAEESQIDGYWMSGVGDGVFIPKKEDKHYTQIFDTGLESGKSYSFSVAPCVTDGTYYYVGYALFGYGAKMPDAVLVTDVSFAPDPVLVRKGHSKKVYGNCKPLDAENTELEWSVQNEGIASVVRLTDIQEQGTDVALVTGNALGVTKLHTETTDASKRSIDIWLAVVPDAVQGVSCQTCDAGILLSWEKLEDVQGYQIFRKKESEEWKLVGDTTQDSWVDKTGSAGGECEYKVAAYVMADSGEKFCGEDSQIVEGEKRNGIVQSPMPTMEGKEQNTPIPTEKAGNAKEPLLAAASTADTGAASKNGLPTLETAEPVLKAGEHYTVKGYRYKILSENKVAFVGMEKKTVKKITIKATVQIRGKEYKIVQIAPKACKNYKKLKKVIIGKNITKIGKQAFYGAGKLNVILMKNKTLQKIGKDSFKKVQKTALLRANKTICLQFKEAQISLRMKE